MPSREAFLKWAVESGFPMRGSLGEHGPVPLWDAEIEALCNRVWNEAIAKSISIVETYKVSVGNSAAGEMAAEWTMENLREVREELRKLKQGEPSA